LEALKGGLTMKIEILGVDGCPNCTALVQDTIDLLAQLQIPAGVSKVTDQAVIKTYGQQVIPGFVINGKLKASGRLPNKAEIIKWVKEEYGA
jgi:hypothetical protein